MKLLSEILIEAKELISNPENWTKGVWSRNKSGDTVLVFSSSAACFCVIGAAVRVSGCTTTASRVSNLSLDKLGVTCGRYNDNHSHPEVLQFMDKLIEAAKEEEL